MDVLPAVDAIAAIPDREELPEGIRTIAEILERIYGRIESLAQLWTTDRPKRLLYDIKDIEAATGISPRTIERLRSAGRFPQPDLRINKAVRWKVETIR